MSLTHCNVHFSQQPDKVAYISTSLLKSLKLSGTKSIRLRLGKDQIPATIKPIQKAGRHLYLTSALRKPIRVPKSGSVYLRNKEGDVGSEGLT
ncbi:YheC/YheD family protein, partial [Paenibacillus sp. 28ISP30-2]|nr:YheC/YheD family protein [Paenibacillus sp. 28ISP30-2]